MKKILLSCLLIIILFSFNNKIFSKSVSDEFNDGINENYDYYNVFETNNSIFDLIIINGTTNDGILSLSIYFKQSEGLNNAIRVTESRNQKSKTYEFSKDSMVEKYYKMKIKWGYSYEISVIEKDSFISMYSCNIDSYENITEFNENAMFKGLNNNNFENIDRLKTNVYNLETRDKIAVYNVIGIFIGIILVGFLSFILFRIIIKWFRKNHSGALMSRGVGKIMRYFSKNRKYIYTLDEILNMPSSKFDGKTICFQTDTVYGIGTKIYDSKGIKKIYRLKNREAKKPIAVLAGSVEDVTKHIIRPSEKAYRIMEKYWPGALTIVFDSKYLTDTIAFRIPNNEYTIELLNHLGPLATTSVNISGEPPLNTIEEIDKTFGYRIDYIVKFPTDLPSSNVSSTVIKFVKDEVVVLRQGDVIVELEEEPDENLNV